PAPDSVRPALAAAVRLSNGPICSRVTGPALTKKGCLPGRTVDTLRNSASADPRCEKAPSCTRHGPAAPAFGEVAGADATFGGRAGVIGFDTVTGRLDVGGGAAFALAM